MGYILGWNTLGYLKDLGNILQKIFRTINTQKGDQIFESRYIKSNQTKLLLLRKLGQIQAKF